MNLEIDIDSIEPGTTIEQSTVEQLVEINKKDDPLEFQLRLLQLSGELERLLWKAGKHYTVRISNGEVQVLTHEEASRYNNSRFDNAIDKMRRCNRRLAAVDVGKLSKDAREDHGKAIIKQSRILSLVKSARRELVLTPEQPKKPVVVIRKK